MSVFPIGIDLGTSTSVVCAFRDGRPDPVPSRLSKQRSPIVRSWVGRSTEGGEPFVGFRADRYREHPGCFVQEVKRTMGTDQRIRLGPTSHRPQEISAIILQQLVRAASAELDAPITEAVISVPANFKDAARQATMDAAQIAGLDVPMLIAEPTAAALAFGIMNLDIDERVVVFDFGGGTLDISMLQMFEGVIDVERVDGDSHLGGKDIDTAIVQWVLQTFATANPHCSVKAKMEQVLWKECESAKIRLSSSDETTIYLANFASCGNNSVPLDVVLRRTDLERVIAPIIDRGGDCLRRLLNGSDSVKRIDPRSIGRVLMVGGSSYIPAIRRRVAEIIGREVSVDVDPEMAVGMGACIRAAIHAGVAETAQDVVLADVSPFSVGVEVVSQLRADAFLPGVFSPLLERNMPIPHRSSHVYHLMHAGQSEVEVNVFQGNSAFVAENELLARAHIKDVPPSSDERPREIHIHFSFDLSGIVTLEAIVPNTKCHATLAVDPRQGRMSESERQEAAAALSMRLQQTPRYEGAKALLDRATTLIDRHGEEGVPRIAHAANQLKGALLEGIEAVVDAAEDALTDALLDEGDIH